MAAPAFPDPFDHPFPEWILFDDYFYHAKDIVSFGTELTTANLVRAYRLGVFPWHIDGMPLPWYCPETRAILEFSELHIPKSLEKARRRAAYRLTIDAAFPSVIDQCSRVRRKGEKGTWITPEFVTAYTELHGMGMAHSVEVWNDAGELVGGLYGVDAGGVFCGESMFHVEPNTSKIALLHLVEHLQKKHATWLDVQVMTPHLRALGAREVPRKQFLRKLKETQGFELKLFGSRTKRAPHA